MKEYRTEQENFWNGEFGDKYVERNDSEKEVAGNIALFSKILGRTSGVKKVIEFGSNIGENLKAIKCCLPAVECAAVEINHKAASILKNDPFFGSGGVKVYEGSILEFQAEENYDFALIKGVLIHIHPDELGNVYQKLYDCSSRYICIAEYYNPVPVEIDYRGNDEKLFKRDFAGELLDLYPDVRLVDYGFTYRRDNVFYYDDTTWFLLEKI